MDTNLGSMTFVPPYGNIPDKVEYIEGKKYVYLDNRLYVTGDPMTPDILLEHIMNARKRLDILEGLIGDSQDGEGG